MTPAIPHEQLRDNLDDVLRRAEAGEEFTITVAGQPVAQLGPVQRRHWVRDPGLAKIWQTSPNCTSASSSRATATSAHGGHCAWA